VLRSCLIQVKDVKPTDQVVTIEGLADENGRAVQKAWLQLEVAQCGYCQTGQIMAATALLRGKPKPTDEDINAAMTNICRCGTYQRIRQAIHLAAGNKQQG
jgi:isoquinoline 1-oxidoreductase alpha subunit